tara:strand:- start:16005 stop:17306 length:1302 start_codon:yes stop_codon:yes gene_type:complete
MKIQFELAEILKVQSASYQESSMIEYIIQQLELLKKQNHDIYYHVETIKLASQEIKNIYVTKGSVSGDEHYPCFVSHTDTVHSIIDHLYIAEGKTKEGLDTLYGYTNATQKEYGGKFIMPAGCGADDKVGIWACLNLIANLDVCKLAFFAAEEVGCVGSSKADKKFFADVGYALQTDRKGNEDFSIDINGTEMNDKKFRTKIKDLVKNRGYKFSKTFTTDVGQLKKDGINVCMSNISSGYYNAHQDEEYVIVKEAENTLGLMFDIYIRLGLEKQYHKPEEKYQVYKGINQTHKGKFVDVKTKPYTDDNIYSEWEQEEEISWNRSYGVDYYGDKIHNQAETNECKECGDDLKIINSHKVCVNPNCDRCNVEYGLDFLDNYAYAGMGYVDPDALYPVYDTEFAELIAYYSPGQDKMYYKPLEIPYQNPKQVNIPF